MSNESQDLRTKLSQEIGTADWSLLAPHAQSEKLIVVDDAVVLLDAALAVANNDTHRITHWIEGGQLTKLTPDQQTKLEDEKAAFFQFVIVAPFVLAQRVLLAPQSTETL